MRWPLGDADLAYAAEGMAEAPSSAFLVELLLCLLCHRDPSVREACVMGIAPHSWFDSRVLIALELLSLTDESPCVRRVAEFEMHRFKRAVTPREETNGKK